MHKAWMTCEAPRDLDARRGLNEACIGQTQTAKAQVYRTLNANLMLNLRCVGCEAYLSEAWPD